jgi:hypothetical protein
MAGTSMVGSTTDLQRVSQDFFLAPYTAAVSITAPDDPPTAVFTDEGSIARTFADVDASPVASFSDVSLFSRTRANDTFVMAFFEDESSFFQEARFSHTMDGVVVFSDLSSHLRSIVNPTAITSAGQEGAVQVLFKAEEPIEVVIGEVLPFNEERR